MIMIVLLKKKVLMKIIIVLSSDMKGRNTIMINDCNWWYICEWAYHNWS